MRLGILPIRFSRSLSYEGAEETVAAAHYRGAMQTATDNPSGSAAPPHLPLHKGGEGASFYRSPSPCRRSLIYRQCPWRIASAAAAGEQCSPAAASLPAVRHRDTAVKSCADVSSEIATTASCPAPVGGARQALFFRLPFEGSTETVLGKYGFAGTLVTVLPQKTYP